MINSISASAQVSQSPQHQTPQPAVHHKHKPEPKQDSVELSPEAQKASAAGHKAGNK